MATLTSTGNVNLTTSTNWSPAQIPQAGDDLIIGAATLTLDADLILNTVTFNNAASRIAFTGTTRTLTATNGFFVTANLGGNRLCQTDVATGLTLNFFGKWTISAGASNSNSIAHVTGGTLNISSIGGNQSSQLIELISSAQFLIFTATLGTINTTGIINYLAANTASHVMFISGTGADWNHYSIGTNLLNASRFTNALNFDGPSLTVINGNWLSTNEGVLAKFFNQVINKTTTFNGNISFVNNYDSIFARTGGNAVVVLNGELDQGFNNASSVMNSNFITLRWQNQTRTIAANKRLNFLGPVQAAGLILNNSGKVIFQSGIVSDSSTQIRQQSLAGQVLSNDASLDTRTFPLQLAAPTLPSVQNVASGTTYGYTGFLQTGTGLILDPAILAAAISANIPDIVDGVHEADLRDYEDTNHSLAWTLKKLRQANPVIEFEITDDVTATATTFSVNLTGFENGSFQNSVLYMDAEGTLAGENSTIITYTQETGYGVVVLEKPLSGIPVIGEIGFIRPDSHVHSVAEIQEGLAEQETLETGITSILEGIGEIDVDFTPIEEMIEISTDLILAAIAEEDDPTNIVNLLISIEDEDDLAVSGAVISVQGTALSETTNVNGVALLKLSRNENYNLRFITPPGYSGLPEESIEVGINDITLNYVVNRISIPPIDSELCQLDIFVKSQGTTGVEPLENVKVSAKLIDGYLINNADLNLNIIDVATSSENGYVKLILLKNTDYDLAVTMNNSIMVKRIRIKTTDQNIQQLSEVI
jgi:hypothetical protein